MTWTMYNVTETHLTASFPGQPGYARTKKAKPVWKARGYGMALASAGPYANHWLHAPVR